MARNLIGRNFGWKCWRDADFALYLRHDTLNWKDMISKEVQEMIPKIQHFCVGQPIKKAWLFGSCSRGEETSESDVDILVEYDRLHERISLMRIAGMMIGLEDLLHSFYPRVC